MFTVEGREQLEQNGFELYEGSAELTDDSLYVTDFLLEECFNNIRSDKRKGDDPQWYVREGEALVPLDPDVYDVQSLIGKTVVDMSVGPDGFSYNIAGIVRTGYEQYYYHLQVGILDPLFVSMPWNTYLERYGDLPGAYHDEALYHAHASFLLQEIFRNVYCTREYALRHQSDITFENMEYDPHTLVISAETETRCDTMQFHDITSSEWSIGSVILDGSDTAVTNSDYGDIKLEAGEIILDERSYNALFGGLSCREYLLGSTVLKRPAKLGETVHLFVERNGKIILDKDFKLVGVVMSEGIYEGAKDRTDGVVCLGEEDMYDLAATGLFPKGIVLRTDRVSEGRLYRALSGLRYDGALSASFEYSSYIYRIEPYQKLIGYAFLALGVIMAIVTLLIIVSLISYNILAQKREIGILRALGARASDVSKIYLAQAAILSVVTFLVSMAIALILVAVLNAIFANAMLAGLVFLGSTGLTWVVLVVGSFGLIFAGTLLPLRKISRYNPADAIKQA